MEVAMVSDKSDALGSAALGRDGNITCRLELPLREIAMKYLIAWALGVPGVVILAWILFF
jgi:hypothetical protein